MRQHCPKHPEVLAECYVPDVMCRACALEFFRGLVRVGAGLAQLPPDPSNESIRHLFIRRMKHTGGRQLKPHFCRHCSAPITDVRRARLCYVCRHTLKVRAGLRLSQYLRDKRLSFV